MLASAPADRHSSVLAGVLWLAGLMALYFILGHLFMVWDGSFASLGDPSGAPDSVTACPSPFCGTWFPR